MDIPPDLIITMSDIRRFHCVRGIRRWFGEQGLDFRAFLRNGIPATELAATGDAFALRVVELTMRDRADG
jgi:hypothetical protein